MKKIIIAFCLIISSILPCFADFMPHSSDSINHYGIGVMRLNTVVNIYEEKDENSLIVQKIYWDNLKNFNNLLKIREESTFVAFYPKKYYAFLSVEDEDETGNWFYVCYDQENKLYGWVKQNNNAKFYSWSDFIMTFGRKHGLYLFDNTSSKNLYAKAEDDSQVVDSFTYTKYIQPWFINGNWLMVKVIDYDNQQKTGYLPWRTDDGKLLLFVKFR